MTGRDRDLQLRVRKGKGRLQQAEFLLKLSEALGMDVPKSAFLGLEETDALREKFFDRVKRAQEVWKSNFRPGDESLWNRIAIIRDGIGARPVTLLHRKDDVLGGLRLPAASVLARAREVWSVVGGDLSLTSPDLGDGFCLEFNHYHDHDEYELTVWGGFQPKAASA